MFNQVKAKLTFIFTLSLVFLLISFIGILYFLISHEIEEKEIAQIEDYYVKDRDDFAEDIGDDDDYHGIEYDPNRSLFYYVYNQAGELVYGKETLLSLSGLVSQNLEPDTETFTKRIEWGQNHILMIKKPLDSDGFVILGKNITAEHHLIQRITWTLFILTILFSAIYAVVGYYFAGQAIKPIKKAFHKQEQFVSDASHELRTPLSIFYSSVDLLLREEKENLSPLGQEVLEDVRQEAQLMHKLIHDMLDLARSDKGQLTLDLKRINLSELVTILCRRFARKQSDIIHFQVEIERNLFFIGDEVRIQQLLYILLDNAFRYTQEGNVTIRLLSEQNKLKLQVEDTGCGISEKNIPFIFDRFFREDETRKKGGAGLGLSIAQSIVHAHGGQILVKSLKGKGTTFTVMLPKK